MTARHSIFCDALDRKWMGNEWVEWLDDLVTVDVDSRQATDALHYWAPPPPGRKFPSDRLNYGETVVRFRLSSLDSFQESDCFLGIDVQSASRISILNMQSAARSPSATLGGPPEVM